ncbi:MAG: helix-turn-helix transcriptional regulator [Bacilli bacterium]|nr:helix-turn-helix transcriptional regulator [Bacilli bacterium]
MKISKNDNKYIYVIVGKNIRRIRKEKGLTQVQLADLIQYNEGTIANIENSSYQTFSLEFLYVISKKLDVPMVEFFKDID